MPPELQKCEVSDRKKAENGLWTCGSSLFRNEKSRLVNLWLGKKSPEEEEGRTMDLMLLLSKIAQRDIRSGCSLPPHKGDRRPRRNVKANRLTGLFTACKLRLYKKRRQKKQSRPQLFIQYKEKSHVSLSLSPSISLSLCPHEECVRALLPDSSASDVPGGKKQKKKRIKKRDVNYHTLSKAANFLNFISFPFKTYFPTLPRDHPSPGVHIPFIKSLQNARISAPHNFKDLCYLPTWSVKISPTAQLLTTCLPFFKSPVLHRCVHSQ